MIKKGIGLERRVFRVRQIVVVIEIIDQFFGADGVARGQSAVIDVAPHDRIRRRVHVDTEGGNRIFAD